MPDPQQKPWSDNPNAPKIPYSLYVAEKADFAGILIGSILYGILIVLFFQCMAALLDPARRRREGVRWGLVFYTVAMFSFSTVLTGMGLNIQSLSFIDNREFPGIEGVLPPGPLGYQGLVRPMAFSIIPNLMFFLNNWLAEGLLLYRCYVTYSMNLWVVVIPSIMYLGSVAMGIMALIRWSSRPDSRIWKSVAFNFSIPYFSISVTVNVLLTLMIVARLVLHSRNVRTTPARVGGLYKTVITMLIESSALYAVSSLLVVAQSSSGVMSAFLAILSQTQVIAPLLIVKRVAGQNMLANATIVSGRAGSFNIRSQRASTGDIPPSGYPMSPTDKYGKTSSELQVRVETTIDLHQDSKV